MGIRIKIVLRETTLAALNGLAKPGERGRFIDRAVQHYVANRSTEALRAQLERAAVRDQDLDREVAAEWFAVDHGSSRLEETNTPRKPAIRPDSSD